MTHASVHIQIAPESAPTTPCWFAEVAMMAEILKTYGLVKLIETKVRFARARFDHYELIDFVAVLIGYALSGEPSLQAFYERLAPFSEVFMALFERSRCPIAAPSPVFWARLISQVWRHYGPCFRRISWPEPRSALLLAGFRTARGSTGW